MMNPYVPHTHEDRRRMLASIGLDTIDQLFDDIPADIRYPSELPIGTSLSEEETSRALLALAHRNLNAVSFLGAGSYDRLIPATVKALSALPSFVTAYTPYQPEVSQGLLQAIFEYQTMVCELTGMDVSNASLYDGHSAAAEAAALSLGAKRKSSVVLVSSTVHPFTLQVLETWAKGTGFSIELIPRQGGVCDISTLPSLLHPEVAGVILQTPNRYGFIEDYSGVADLLHGQNMLLTISSDPLSLALQRSQGEWGADIAIGDTQPLGIPCSFGGPTCGYMAVRKNLMRRIPGRIVGQTVDTKGNRAFVLTLQAREQHIKRERATSNICSNQALAALTTTIHLSLVGWDGLVEAARQSMGKAHYLADALIKLPHVRLAADAPFWCEFPLLFDTKEVMELLLAELKKAGIFGGVRMGSLSEAQEDAPLLLVAVTEKRTRAGTRFLYRGGEEDSRMTEPLLFDISRPGRHGYDYPPCDVPEVEALPQQVRRLHTANLPGLSEFDVVRHFSRLSTMTFGVDYGMYPLGSCTMKYNPKLNEQIASLEGFTATHPLQDADTVQGSLELMYRLLEKLSEITGMDWGTLQPSAGAHGEYTGLKIIKNHHDAAGDYKRTRVIVPVSAHGTNPASAALNGYSITEVPTDDRGLVDIEVLKELLDETVAAIMLTNPNTLGLFEKDIRTIASLVHDAGGLLYYDGANMNAIMGIVRPGDMGFDVVHLNLHKTFATPHGGGGPGAGPVMVKKNLIPYLPRPDIICRDNVYSFDWGSDRSIGKVAGFWGNFLVLVRAYTYILRMGSDGLKSASQHAVLNANYLLSRLKGTYDHPYGGLCKHEFVLSLQVLKEKTGVTALDIAKAMLDRGYHPPTMYFPLIVHEALMFEPTESESPRIWIDLQMY